MTGYDSTKLTGMIEKVTAGATGALGNIKMSGFEAGDLSGMVEKISAGATSALGEIKMTGYDSNDLSAMVEVDFRDNRSSWENSNGWILCQTT